jgi:hypothetical protein
MRKLSILFLLLIIASCGSRRRYRSKPFTHQDPVAANSNLSNYQKAMSLKNKWGNINNEHKKAFAKYLKAAATSGDEQAKVELAKYHLDGLKVWKTGEYPISKDEAQAFNLFNEVVKNSKNKDAVCSGIKSIAKSWSLKKNLTPQDAFHYNKKSQELNCASILDKDFDYLIGPMELYLNKNSNNFLSKINLEKFIDKYAPMALNKTLPKTDPSLVYKRWEFLTKKSAQLANIHANRKKNSRFSHFTSLADNLIKNFPYLYGKNVDSYVRVRARVEASASLAQVYLNKARSVRMKDKVNWYNRAYNSYRSALNSASGFSKESRKSAQADYASQLCNIQYEIITVAKNKKYIDNALNDCNVNNKSYSSSYSSYHRGQMLNKYYRFKAEKISTSDKGLPTQIRKDKYMLKAADYLKVHKYGDAYPYLFSLITMEKSKRIKLPHSTIYYYADTCYKLGMKQQAKDYLNIYFKRTGRKGRYYKDALSLHSKIQ